MLGKTEGQEKAATEDKVVGWLHWFNGHESEQTPGDCKGQGSLACCSPWGSKELDMTERLNSNNILAVPQDIKSTNVRRHLIMPVTSKDSM